MSVVVVANDAMAAAAAVEEVTVAMDTAGARLDMAAIEGAVAMATAADTAAAAATTTTTTTTTTISRHTVFKAR
jgi:uncharacterized protein YaiI (UPF0178 family)